MKLSNFVFSLFALIGLLLIGCENTNEIFKPFTSKDTNSQSQKEISKIAPETAPEGAVYTMTNDARNNEIVVFHRSSNGYLDYSGSYPTTGRGTGTSAFDPLASQGSIVISDGHIQTAQATKAPRPTERWLCAVNAGSNNISVFAIVNGGLDLRDVKASGGELPVSLTMHNDLLYVLNRSGSGRGTQAVPSSNITGFRISKGGRLSAIENSVRPLGGSAGAGTGSAQIQFSPGGKFLVVTEKETNVVDVFVVKDDGSTEGPFVNESAGATPFGFDFDYKSRLIVSEAFGNMPYQSTVSSYELGLKKGFLRAIDPSVRANQSGASRVVVNPYNDIAYVANTYSGTISGFLITDGGNLQSISEDNTLATLGKSRHPIDMALSQYGRFLYVLDSELGTVYSFKVASDGKLVPFIDKMQMQLGFPGSIGLAAY